MSQVPTKNCRRYHAPLTLDDAFHAYHTIGGVIGEHKDKASHEDHTPSAPLMQRRSATLPDSRRCRSPQDVNVSEVSPQVVQYWMQMYQQNTQCQWLSRDIGCSFLDIAPLSIRRPDGMMAHYISTYDCLHSCLPGVTDTWSKLLFNLVSSVAEKLLTHGRKGGKSPSRTFELSLEEWLASGAARNRLETCRSAAAAPGAPSECAIATPLLTDQDWWPFRNFVKRAHS